MTQSNRFDRERATGHQYLRLKLCVRIETLSPKEKREDFFLENGTVTQSETLKEPNNNNMDVQFVTNMFDND